MKKPFLSVWIVAMKSSSASSPYGIPRSAPRLRPWVDGRVQLPNGLRAKIVRVPSMADALDAVAQSRPDIAADIAAAGGWNPEDE